VFTVLKQDGELFWSEVSRRENILTGKISLKVAKHQLPFDASEPAGLPSFLMQNAQGDQVYLAWRDGTVRRYDLRRVEEPVVAEVTDFVPEAGAELTGFAFMFGDQSIIATDSLGRVNGWFRVERPAAGTLDGYQLVAAHTLPPHDAAVSVAAMSTRDKGLLTATVKGEVVLRHLTSERVLGTVQLPAQTAIESLQLTPKADGIFAVDADGGAWLWDIHNPHPETTWKTIFGKVWYEGYPQPTFTWQSSSGNDDFEPKFSLIPLIFGTLKATAYSLFFAIPIALLGAIYTSQFLDKRLRSPIKSAVETMASLPSVVLGFIAALVLAPIVENWVVAVLTVFAAIPLAVILAGYLWQMLPQPVIVRYAGWPQFLMLFGVVFVALVAGRSLGGPIEHWLFQADFKGWLDGRVGTAVPGIAILAWPMCLLVVWFAQRKLVAERSGLRFRGMSRVQIGMVELAKLLGILAATTLLAWLVGVVLAGLGADPRGALVGTYVQRNTLVVGFVMGFAVIPIIYTISEDALSSVPEHLRSASLGCGATPWQTAVRVILPVAMSGIFSAVMIGLGRAVGETMIVVMAAGNTPLLDANIFNGLRALSANIAVELPEAVKDGTLYRMLFLAALTLFVMTFFVNTLAEIVRMRFRKRAFQL
jgi:phosphate transport system permease protein